VTAVGAHAGPKAPRDGRKLHSSCESEVQIRNVSKLALMGHELQQEPAEELLAVVTCHWQNISENLSEIVGDCLGRQEAHRVQRSRIALLSRAGPCKGCHQET
jgi:hypothetical protein